MLVTISTKRNLAENWHQKKWNNFHAFMMAATLQKCGEQGIGFRNKHFR